MQNMEFILESPRLGFRLMADSDFEQLKLLDMDPEVRAFFPGGIASPKQIRERIERNRLNFAVKGYCDFAVIHKESGRFAGRCGFGDLPDGEIEVGYVFLKEFWGQGLAQEALSALLHWAEQHLDVERILAYAPTAHTASINVMKKSGMRYLKTEKAHGVDCFYYSYPISERHHGPATDGGRFPAESD
jgi:[ribosomal protein S5]-alanine N-acetyltransferase